MSADRGYMNKILEDYEKKLRLVEKFVLIKSQIREMKAEIQTGKSLDREELTGQLDRILEQL